MDDTEAELEKPYNPTSQVNIDKAQEVSIATDIPVDQVEAEVAMGDNTAEVVALQQGVNFNYAAAIEKSLRRWP